MKRFRKNVQNLRLFIFNLKNESANSFLILEIFISKAFSLNSPSIYSMALTTQHRGLCLVPVYKYYTPRWPFSSKTIQPKHLSGIDAYFVYLLLLWSSRSRLPSIYPLSILLGIYRVAYLT